jgi:phospholipid transport system transporter-binding protein
MKSAQLVKTDDGCLLVSGDLSMDTVPELLKQGHLQSGSDGDIRVDLQGVERADSAGVALLIEWQRAANRQQHTIHFQNIPSQMLAIARLSGVDELLALN